MACCSVLCSGQGEPQRPSGTLPECSPQSVVVSGRDFSGATDWDVCGGCACVESLVWLGLRHEIVVIELIRVSSILFWDPILEHESVVPKGFHELYGAFWIWV